MSAILCIDTASARFALALARDGVIAAEAEQDAAQDHSRLLLATIDRLLGGDRTSLTEVLVVRGPGSYAGLRVGIAIARGLGIALGVPVTGIGTMEAVAIAAGGGRLTAIHPAGRGDYAAQDFDGSVAVGPLHQAGAAELAGRRLAGESAGSLGGREIGPLERCRSALQRRLERGPGESVPVDALYLREPAITLPRRPRLVKPA